MSPYVEIHLHILNLLLHHTDHSDPFHYDMREFVTNKFMGINPHIILIQHRWCKSLPYFLCIFLTGFLIFLSWSNWSTVILYSLCSRCPRKKSPAERFNIFPHNHLCICTNTNFVFPFFRHFFSFCQHFLCPCILYLNLIAPRGEGTYLILSFFTPPPHFESWKFNLHPTYISLTSPKKLFLLNRREIHRWKRLGALIWRFKGIRRSSKTHF